MNATKILLSSIFVFLSFTAMADSGFKLATYNIGLAHTFVPMAKARRAHIIENLTGLDADAVCIQELWTPEDILKFQKTLDKSFPYQHVVSQHQKFASKTPACSIRRIFGKNSVGRCIFGKCRKKKGDEFTNCVINDCNDAIKKLKNKDKDCAQALFAQVGKNFIKGIMSIIVPFKKVGLFAWEGSSGLAFFSKHPILETKEMDFFDISTMTRRSSIYAMINVGGVPKHIFCTHLTANMKRIPYVGNFDSWTTESKEQATKLVEFAKKTTGGKPHYIAGDFNCSFPDPDNGISSNAIETCNVFKNNGYLDPVMATGECTYCENNSLNDENTTTSTIDHIFVKGAGMANIEAQIIMKKKVELANGKTSHLSDHFGVILEQQ
ncbi:MAG: endonuclease/exonuclease/phosphatase family protein [Bacteriovoracaceae bacterium]|nr:endonuclease/exonuclease/phosphatase family protein [Bacteriovoracaceae bacterium]